MTNWNGATLTYDANGNMTSDGTNTYTWDARNHLASIAGNFTAGFEYDPFGRRLGKTINGNTTNFLYDGLNPVQELVGGSPSANLLAGLGVDEYFQRTDLTGTSNFLTDALGSTVALADPTGTVQTQYTYDPFGGTTTQGAANANSFQFTGRENDSDGLYFYRARYYSPMYGRFVGQDPLRFDGGDPNLYEYAFSSPMNLADSLGLSSLVFCRSAHELQIFDNSGREVGVFGASNNAASNSLGPWPNGVYKYAYHKDHPADPNGPYGEHGIFVFNVPGRTGLGVHSGRRDRTDKAGRHGFNYATEGCIRTTDEAMKLISDLNKTDPLQKIKVTNDCN